jgi:hypothetical protein
MERHIKLLMYSVKNVLQIGKSYPKDVKCIFVNLSIFISTFCIAHDA